MISQIGTRLKQEFDPLENFICLTIVAPKNYEETNFEFAKYMIDRGAEGLYVTTNHPYSFLVQKLQEKNIPVDKLYFIDGVSGESGEDFEDCIYLDSLENLTGLGILINHVMAGTTGKKFLIIDSLSTLLLYNAAGSLAKFAHFLTARMKMWGVSGIFITLKDQSDPLLVSHLSQVCDKILDLSS